jgi:hypothetical protein
MTIIANSYGGRAGLPYVYGALLVSGGFGILIAKPFSMVLRFFPPLVTGTVIVIIGLSLIGADIGLIAGDPAAKDFGQVSHIALAGLVILLIVAISRIFAGFIGQTAVLISIVLGSLVAWPIDLLKFPSVGDAKWVGFPDPFHFGAPKFAAAAITSTMIAVFLLNLLFNHLGALPTRPGRRPGVGGRGRRRQRADSLTSGLLSKARIGVIGTPFTVTVSAWLTGTQDDAVAVCECAWLSAALRLALLDSDVLG